MDTRQAEHSAAVTLVTLKTTTQTTKYYSSVIGREGLYLDEVVETLISDPQS